MAKNRRKIDAAVQERLGEVAAELRQMIYGEQGYPEWGTKFAQIEDEGMAVGLELARVVDGAVRQRTGHAHARGGSPLPGGNRPAGRHGSGGPKNPSR